MSQIAYNVYRHAKGIVRITNETLSTNRLAGQHQHVVLVQPRVVGVCSADVRELRGERPGRQDFGHEVVGTVIESTHDAFATGDCVVLNPFIKVERETAFSELMYVAGPKELVKSALIKVSTDSLVLSATEPLACVIHAARQSHVEGPCLIVGAGFFGYLLYRYLEINGAQVTLANRSRDRVDHLLERAGSLSILLNLEQCGARFASVFLMQAHLSQQDIVSAARLVREGGEIVLFGAIDRTENDTLYTIRSTQQRVPCVLDDGKSYYLQGTLDATCEDFKEANRMLSDPRFVHAVEPIFAQPLTFEKGATHLTQRAVSPRSYLKHVIRIDANGR